MQNITRTFTKYVLKAYDIVDGEEGIALMEIAEAETAATSMTKGAARAELAKVYGGSLPRGCTVKWDAVGSITYAMPLDEFIANASVLETK